MKTFTKLLLFALVMTQSLCNAQTYSPNSQSPSAVYLVDPSTGQPYFAGSSDASSILPIANFYSPLSVMLIDPTTGQPYKAGSGGGGSGTVNNGTGSQLGFYGSTGNAISGTTDATIANGALTLGTSGILGTITFGNATSGTVTVTPPTGALGTTTITLPSASGTLLYSGGPGGTPSSLVGTNITGTALGLSIGGNAASASAVPVGGITGLGTGVGTFLATPTAANLGSAVTGAGNAAGQGIAVSGTWPTQTISSNYSVRTVTGSSDTILSTDCANGVNYTFSGAVAVTLPQATGSFAGCGVDISAASGTTVTVTPTTSTINSASTAVVGPSLWDQVVAVSGNYNAYGTGVSFAAGVTYLLDEGTKFTIASGTGACATTTTLTGGTAIGSFVCSGTSGASTAVITLPTAPNGIWICKSLDKTTSADTFLQTTWSSTSATLGGTIVSGDVIGFSCSGS